MQGENTRSPRGSGGSNNSKAYTSDPGRSMAADLRLRLRHWDPGDMASGKRAKALPRIVRISRKCCQLDRSISAIRGPSLKRCRIFQCLNRRSFRQGSGRVAERVRPRTCRRHDPARFARHRDGFAGTVVFPVRGKRKSRPGRRLWTDERELQTRENYCLLRRTATPITARPAPRRNSDAGSGTGVP